MKHHFPIITVALITTVMAGRHELPTQDDRVQSAVPKRPLDLATIDAGLNPTDERIVALVSWLRSQGITLELEGSGEWKVTQPEILDEYGLSYSIRSFPAWASEQQMRHGLMHINLAYILNAPAHLAMSYGRVRSHVELPKLGSLPVTKAIPQLFKQYEAR